MDNEIKLVNFRIIKVDFKLNEGMKPDTKFNIKPKIEFKMGRKENTLFVNISARVNEDLSSPVPFNLDVAIFGTFVVEKELEQKILMEKAMNLLFPHLRSAVAGITANCYIMPYLLPIPTLNEQSVNDVHSENLN